MNRRYIFWGLVLVFLIGCTPANPPKPIWSSNANQTLLGDVSYVSTREKATLAITHVACGPVFERAYEVGFAWVTTVDNPDYARVEYDIMPAEFAGYRLNSPTIGLELDLPGQIGEETLFIPSDRIEKMGDKIVVRMLIGETTGYSAVSQMDTYEVKTLCEPIESEEEIVDVIQGIE